MLTQVIGASVNVQSTIMTSNDGLGNNVVRHIFQDSRGFLWMSTLNGLTRYDGHSFVTFRPGTGDEISLLRHHITRVTEDSNNFLWINVSPDYFSCYDLKKGCFVDFTGCGEYNEKYLHRLEVSDGDSWLWHRQNGARRVSYKNGQLSSTVFKKENGKLPSNFVKQIIEGANGSAWICTDSGLVKIEGEESRIIATGINISDAIMYMDTLYFVTSEAEIYKADPHGAKVEYVQAIDKKNNYFDIISGFQLQEDWIILTSEKGYVFRLSEQKMVSDPTMDVPNGRHIKDDHNNLWIYDDKGLIRHININTRAVKDIHVKADNKIAELWCKIIQDSRGLFWISTFGDGLYIYNPVTEEMTHFTYETGGVNHICSNTLTSVMEDRSGGIWITSEPSGVSRVQVLNDGASYIYPEKKSRIDQMNTVRAIARMRNGEIWLSNRNNEAYIYDENMENKLRTLHFPSRIYKIFEDRSGKIWLGSRGSGLCIDEVWYTKQPENPQSISNNNIYDIFCDYKQRMWVATFGGGLNLAIPEDNRYKFKSFLRDNYNMQFVRFIASDKNNWMWIGSNDGICVFHPDSLIKSPDNYYKYNYNGKLLGNEVKYILCDRKGQMWIGTLGGGLSLCVPDGDYGNLSFKHYTTGNGLVGNDVQAIAEDREGTLWIATEYGISHFSPETESFENFFFSTIAQGNVYSESTTCNLPDDRLLFGSSHGMVIIDPEKVKSLHTASGVALTGLKINGANMSPDTEDSPLTDAISYTDEVELKHYQNSFVVEFSAFDYSITNSAKYMYKLTPFDNDWNTPSSLNFATYKKLPPGTYRLHVKACNSAGIWSDKEVALGIIIKPPHWKSPVAYIIYLLSLGILLYTAYHLIRKFNALQNRIQVENQLTEYKIMFFTNISHEFRTSLTLIQGALEKIENASRASEEMAYPIRLMNKSTNRMLRLINQLLEFRKMQNNKLTLMLEETEVISFLQEITQNFEDMANEKNIDFRFEYPADKFNMFVDRGKLDKIVYNLLSNAFKYTPDGGKILFKALINEENKKLIFSVNDTGIGISKEKRQELFSRFMQSNFSHDSVGIGLHLTYELVNVHKGNITYHENAGGGSVFTVSLPLDTSQYEGKDFIISGSIQEEPFDHEKPEGRTTMNHLSASGDVPEKKKVLLIEDDNDVSKFLETELNRYFDVITASDGLSGLDKAQNMGPDLIICDVLMPGMNGFDVTRKLKTDFMTCHIPVILLTAMSASENQLEGIECGADAYITKPFSPKLLLVSLFRLIEQHEKLRNKFSNDPTLMNPILSSADPDRKFAEKLSAIMEKQYANPDFTIDDFAAEFKLGRTVFFRKVKGVTGYTPNEYIRVIRMKKAIKLLQDGRYNVSEITYMIGMKDPHYFSRSFKEQFGFAPSAYLHGNGNKVNEE
ncbi:MAG: response regulator [Tannerella sp.]|jgi:signal transduction histidine kinase/ligand-binding sensor domain-containing protein/AraC-like DNA-binding protein/ActR/RegA family two-component response regulator|nr:response regulator [Tannerella sp.]